MAGSLTGGVGLRDRAFATYSFRYPCSLKKISPVDLAWLCGWLEGEGTFGIQPTNGYHYPKIAAASTDMDVLKRVQRLTGVGRVTEIKRKDPKHQRCFIWQVYRANDAIELMKLIEPHMCKRRGKRIRSIIEQVGG